jgi:hypothetical protein
MKLKYLHAIFTASTLFFYNPSSMASVWNTSSECMEQYLGGYENNGYKDFWGIGRVTSVTYTEKPLASYQKYPKYQYSYSVSSSGGYHVVSTNYALAYYEYDGYASSFAYTKLGCNLMRFISNCGCTATVDPGSRADHNGVEFYSSMSGLCNKAWKSGPVDNLVRIPKKERTY